MDELLRDCRTALGDWLTTYAYELCSEENVKAANDRIAEGGGTIAYIAHMVGRINDALEQRASDSADAVK